MSATASVVIAVAASLGCLVSVIFYLRAKEPKARKLMQSLAAILTLVAAAVLLPQGNPSVAVWILVGSVLIALADLLVSPENGDPKGRYIMTILAAVCSAAGYLICAYGLMAAFQPEWEGVLSMFLVGLIAALSYKKRKGIQPKHGLQIPVLLYLCAVLFMGSMGIALAVRNPDGGLILMGLGGACLALSVNMQLAHSYGRKPAQEQYLLARGAHFLGQLLIGWSILFL